MQWVLFPVSYVNAMEQGPGHMLPFAVGSELWRFNILAAPSLPFAVV